MSGRPGVFTVTVLTNRPVPLTKECVNVLAAGNFEGKMEVSREIDLRFLKDIALLFS